MSLLESLDKPIRVAAIGGLIASCGPVAAAQERGANWVGSPAAVETSCTDIHGLQTLRPTPPMPEGFVCINTFDVPGTGTHVVVVEMPTLVTFHQFSPDKGVIAVARQPEQAIAGWRTNNRVELFNFTANPPSHQTVYTTQLTMPVQETVASGPPAEASNRPMTKAARIAFAETLVPSYFPESVKFWVFDLDQWRRAHNLPDSFTRLFAAIIWNESCGNPNAIGGNDYGLGQVNAVHWGYTPVPERLNPSVNIEKAGWILRDALLAAGGDPRLAAEIYTAGAGAVARGQVTATKQAYAMRVAQQTGPSCSY